MATGANRRAEWTSAVVVRAALVATWVVFCDLSLKVMARAGACAEAGGLVDLVGKPWSLPSGCTSVPVLGDAMALAPVAREGGPLGLPAMSGSLGGVLLAGAAVVTILVWVWKYRDPGDALALGALWGGCAALAAPRLQGMSGLAEITVLGMSTGVGDVALSFSLAWLVWRLVAELRA